eukprot:4988093-Amphidinium_carterae.1
METSQPLPHLSDLELLRDACYDIAKLVACAQSRKRPRLGVSSCHLGIKVDGWPKGPVCEVVDWMWCVAALQFQVAAALGGTECHHGGWNA